VDISAILTSVIATLPPASRVEAELAQDIYELADERVRCEASLYEFVRSAWSSIDSSEFQDNWAVEAYCQHLEAVTYGDIKRLLSNFPPRCSKTLVTSVCWPAWVWAQSDVTYLSGPQVRFLCGSYGERLSFEGSNMCRRLLLSPWYQRLWGHRFSLRDDQNSKSKFDNTQNGSRCATSVGGSLLGLGGDIIIVDDPHQTEEVESDDVRAKTIAWWNEIHTTRLNDPKDSAVVVVMQRLHNSDVSGVILDSDEEWCHFVIPMIFDEKQVRRCVTVPLPQYDADEPWQDEREDGDLMWPERFGLKEIEGLRRLGDWFWSGRYQQSPVPAGGGIIKREFWQPWDNVEAQRYGLEWTGARREFPDIELVVASLDTAYGEKEENDYNALTVWGIWVHTIQVPGEDGVPARNLVVNRRAMLMFAWAKRLPLHTREVFAYPNESKADYEARKKESWGLVELVADTCKRYKVRRLLIEDKTRGRDVANELKRLYARDNWGIELIVPTKDKVTRVHSIVPMFTDNAVWAPDTKWSDEVITQASLFPKAEHDDYVDTISMFLLWAREKELLVRADEMSAALEDEAMWKPHEETVAEGYGV
jgi:predicted phage terminase large subunit-like protein